MHGYETVSVHMCVGCCVWGGIRTGGVFVGGARESIACCSGVHRHTLVRGESKGRDRRRDGTHSPSSGTVSKPFQSRNVGSL